MHDNQKQHWTFLILFLCSFALMTSSILALNVLVDPRGIFGAQLYPVLVVTGRAEKCDLLKTADPKPEALILGSSHSMRFSPKKVEELTGLKTFNLSVNAGKMEDFLALLGYSIHEMHLTPNLIILGICARTICRREDEDFDNRLTSNPALMKYIPQNPFAKASAQWKTYWETLNWNYLKDVWKSIEIQDALPAQVNYLFDADGFLNREGPFNEPGRFLRGPIQKDCVITGFSEDRKKYFDLFLEACKAHGIRLEIVITPYAPDYIKRVDELDGSYTRFTNELIQFLEGRNSDHDFALHDFSRIENFGGIDTFMDAAHTSIAQSSLMLEEILK